MLLRKAQRQGVGRVDLQAHRPPPPAVRRVRKLCTSRLSCRESGTRTVAGVCDPEGEQPPVSCDRGFRAATAARRRGAALSSPRKRGEGRSRSRVPRPTKWGEGGPERSEGPGEGSARPKLP